MPLATLIGLIQWAIPTLIKLVPPAADAIRELLNSGDKADWNTLDKYKVDFKSAFPNADV